MDFEMITIWYTLHWVALGNEQLNIMEVRFYVGVFQKRPHSKTMICFQKRVGLVEVGCSKPP